MQLTTDECAKLTQRLKALGTTSHEIELQRLRCDGPLDLSGARLRGGLTIRGCTLASLDLSQAKIDPYLWLQDSEVHGDFTANGLTISVPTPDGEHLIGQLSVERCVMHGTVRADYVEVGAETSFKDTEFQGDTQFGYAKFKGTTTIRRVRFADRCSWGWSQLSMCNMSNTTFETDGWFEGVDFAEFAYFDGVHFRDVWDFGQVFASSMIWVDCTFDRIMRMKIAASDLTFLQCRFYSGLDLGVAWADVSLRDCSLGSRAEVSRAQRPVSDREQALYDAVGERDASYVTVVEGQSLGYRESEQPEPWHGPRPRLTSLRGTNVDTLFLTDVDLRACRFAQATGLEEITIHPSCDFGYGPPRLTSDRRFPFIRCWTRRRTIADEHDLRTAGRPRGAWFQPERRVPHDEVREGQDTLRSPEHVSGIYRQLRRSLEGQSDYAGASDFYYGEMEMRRRGTTIPPAERSLLALYWLTAGYATRASRAMLGLLATAVIAGLTTVNWGLVDASTETSLVDALLSAAAILVPRVEVEIPELSRLGVVIRLLSALVMGGLFALAVLSLRNRVRR